MFLTGAEIFAILKNNDKKILISENDGNKIQRYYEPWTKERLDAYKNSLLSGFPHNPIYLSEYGGKWHVVDGQHRLIAIRDMIGDDQSNIDKTPSKILNIIFEFVILKAKIKAQEKHVKFGSSVFMTLNDTSSNVSNGSLYKSLIRRIDMNLADKLFDNYPFKKEDDKKDDVFDIIGTSLFCVHYRQKLEDDDVATNMARSIKKFLSDTSASTLKKAMTEMLHYFSEFKKTKYMVIRIIIQRQNL